VVHCALTNGIHANSHSDANCRRTRCCGRWGVCCQAAHDGFTYRATGHLHLEATVHSYCSLHSGFSAFNVIMITMPLASSPRLPAESEPRTFYGPNSSYTGCRYQDPFFASRSAFRRALRRISMCIFRLYQMPHGCMLPMVFSTTHWNSACDQYGVYVAAAAR
jgi:hypothetical protein